MTADKVSITAAALRLQLDYQQCRRLVLTGQLGGGRDEFGRLYADTDAVEAFRAQRDSARKPQRESRPKAKRVR